MAEGSAIKAAKKTKTIQKMGKMFLSSPNDSWNILQEMGADYVVVFIAAEKINDNLEDVDSLKASNFPVPS